MILHILYKKAKFRRTKKNLDNIIQVIKETMDPFDEKLLFNISSGKATSEEAAYLLLNVKAASSQQKLDFITDCSLTPARFQKLIKRNKNINFASQCTTKFFMAKNKDKKVLLKMERESFGRKLIQNNGINDPESHR